MNEVIDQNAKIAFFQNTVFKLIEANKRMEGGKEVTTRNYCINCPWKTSS